MKTCHLCEMVVKSLRSTTCTKCNKTHCYPCIIKIYPEKSSSFLPNNQQQALERSKISSCFVCLQQCKCLKCNTKQSVVVELQNVMQVEEKKEDKFNFEDQPVPEGGLFRGKKVAELPNYLRRIYQFKKVLYSKHQISVPSSANIPNPEQTKDKGMMLLGPQEKEKMNEPLLGQLLEASALQQQISISRQVQMEIQNENEPKEPQDEMEDQGEGSFDEQGNPVEESALDDNGEEAPNSNQQLPGESQSLQNNHRSSNSPQQPAPSQQLPNGEDLEVEGGDLREGPPSGKDLQEE